MAYGVVSTGVTHHRAWQKAAHGVCEMTALSEIEEGFINAAVAIVVDTVAKLRRWFQVTRGAASIVGAF